MGLELLIDRNALDAADKEVVDMMNWAAVYMGDTLNDVLSMQKIEEEGKMELKLVPFNIRNSISRSCRRCRRLLSSIIKNLSIKQVITTDVPVLLVGDAYRVEHVISNLLCNAIKFSLQDGTIYMEAISQIIQITETLTSSAGATVSISDEGPGISAENKKKHLTGFFQILPDQLQ